MFSLFIPSDNLNILGEEKNTQGMDSMPCTELLKRSAAGSTLIMVVVEAIDGLGSHKVES